MILDSIITKSQAAPPGRIDSKLSITSVLLPLVYNMAQIDMMTTVTPCPILQRLCHPNDLTILVSTVIGRSRYLVRYAEVRFRVYVAVQICCKYYSSTLFVSKLCIFF